MKSILFVDDEAQILRSLARVFGDSAYDISCASGVMEALGVLKEKKVDLVVSDMKMPDMNGVDFLRLVKEQYPGTLRIILSGYSDEGIVGDALQHNVAMAYLSKPWNNEELTRMVSHLFDTQDLLASGELLAAINGMDELPTLKPFLQDILNAIESDENISAISARIEKDHAVASKVLHIANSAYYGISTGSVKKAVTFLGLHTVRDLIFATSVMDTVNTSDSCRLLAEKIWNHAFLTNRIQQVITDRFLPDRNIAMNSAGLLHNIGIVFMIRQFSTDYIRLFGETLRDPSAVLTDLEKRRFGFTHAEAGGYLLQWWNLPFPVVEAALYHGEPSDGRIVNRELVCTVHIAQKYAGEFMGYLADCRYDAEALRLLGIDSTALARQLEADCKNCRRAAGQD